MKRVSRTWDEAERPTIPSSQKCPVCSVLALYRHYPGNGNYSYYDCKSCGWRNKVSALLTLVRLRRPIDPGVLYLMELLDVSSDNMDDTPPTSRVCTGGSTVSGVDKPTQEGATKKYVDDNMKVGV